MRHCPKCRNEFQDWVQNCIDCGTKLQDGQAPAQEILNQPESTRDEIPFSGDFVTIASFSNEVEAQLYQSVLESEGIRSYIFSEQLLMGSENCIGTVRLRVQDQDAERAAEILRETTTENPEAQDAAGQTETDEVNEIDDIDSEAVEDAEEDDSFESEDEEFVEEETEAQPTKSEAEECCPVCSSRDFQRLGGLFRRARHKCLACGHAW